MTTTPSMQSPKPAGETPPPPVEKKTPKDTIDLVTALIGLVVIALTAGATFLATRAEIGGRVSTLEAENKSRGPINTYIANLNVYKQISVLCILERYMEEVMINMKNNKDITINYGNSDAIGGPTGLNLEVVCGSNAPGNALPSAISIDPLQEALTDGHFLALRDTQVVQEVYDLRTLIQNYNLIIMEIPQGVRPTVIFMGVQGAVPKGIRTPFGVSPPTISIGMLKKDVSPREQKLKDIANQVIGKLEGKSDWIKKLREDLETKMKNP